MFDLLPAAIILEVHRTGSLRQAAAKFKVDQATVARRISAFEKHLGHPVLSRHAKGVYLTPAGMKLLEPSVEIMKSLDAYNEAVYNVTEERMSQVTLMAPRPLITHLYVPSFNVKKTGHPKLKFKKDIAWAEMPNVVFHQGKLDETDPDIIIMFSQDGQAPANFGNEMLVRKIGESRFTLWASQDYIDMNGVPKRFSDLKDHVIIDNSMQKSISVLQPWNEVIKKAKINAVLENSNDVIPLVEAGNGIALLTAAASYYSEKMINIEPVDMPNMTCGLFIAVKREARKIPSVAKVFDTIIDITDDSPWFDENHYHFSSEAGRNSKSIQLNAA